MLAEDSIGFATRRWARSDRDIGGRLIAIDKDGAEVELSSLLWNSCCCGVFEGPTDVQLPMSDSFRTEGCNDI
jgi:hypothetical protein